MVSGVRVSGRALQPLRYGLRNLNLGDDFISIKKVFAVSHFKKLHPDLSAFIGWQVFAGFKVYPLNKTPV